MTGRFIWTGFPAYVIIAVALTGCISGGSPVDTVLSQPRSAVYSCGSEGRLTVRRLGNTIDVVSPRGIEVSLPASPPGQTARYGAPPYALVFDDREALWFVTGKPPIACRQ